MILVTGGLGFIGRHTVRALLDLGESCVLLQRRTPEVPPDLAGERVAIEQVDLGDLAALLAVGERHEITGIVHLAGSVPWPPGAHEPLDGAREALASLLNVVQAAAAWGVSRLGVASTIGVYGGVAEEGPLYEDVPLPMTSGHVIPAFKKIGELLVDHLSGALDVEIVNYRIGAIWGPHGRVASPFIAAPALVHAAAFGTRPDLTALYSPAHAEDAIDLCYGKDCGRAIASLQLADSLSHRTYNVSSGRATTNAEIVAAIRAVVPDARVDLPTGGSGRPLWLDTTRLVRDTGFRPAYDTERAVADYLTWLRAARTDMTT
ncbi:NAD-dependent epimerase/dehydratase family protein [Actinophytocola sp.]|uniref:NAD-dependent epimerase/dehydratase family protein n=1 Tax=Actinophytocola sp. TaxID=1872138 RepID=UPI0038999386